MQLRHYYTLWWLHLSLGLGPCCSRCSNTTPSQWPWMESPPFPPVCETLVKFLTSVTQYKPLLCSLSLCQPGCALWIQWCQSEWLCLWQLHRGNCVGRQDSSATTGGGVSMRPDVAQWHITHAPGLSAIHYSEGKCMCACLLWPTLIKFIHAIGLFRSGHKSKSDCRGNEWIFFFLLLSLLNDIVFTLPRVTSKTIIFINCFTLVKASNV